MLGSPGKLVDTQNLKMFKLKKKCSQELPESGPEYNRIQRNRERKLNYSACTKRNFKIVC